MPAELQIKMSGCFVSWHKVYMISLC